MLAINTCSRFVLLLNSPGWSRRGNQQKGRTKAETAVPCHPFLDCTRSCEEYKDHHSSSPRIQSLSHRGLILVMITAIQVHVSPGKYTYPQVSIIHHETIWKIEHVKTLYGGKYIRSRP